MIFYLSFISSTTNDPVTYDGLQNILTTFSLRLKDTIQQNICDSEQRTLRNVKKEIEEKNKEDLERQEKLLKTFCESLNKKQEENKNDQNSNTLPGIIPILARSLKLDNNNDLMLYILCLLNSDPNNTTNGNSNILNAVLPLILSRINQRGTNQTPLTGINPTCSSQNPLNNPNNFNNLNNLLRGGNPLNNLLGGNPLGNLLGGNNNLLGGNPLGNLLGGNSNLLGGNQLGNLLGSDSNLKNLDTNQLLLLNLLVGLSNEPDQLQNISNQRSTNLYGPSVPVTSNQNLYGPQIPQQQAESSSVNPTCKSECGVETREYGRNYGRRP